MVLVIMDNWKVSSLTIITQWWSEEKMRMEDLVGKTNGAENVNLSAGYKAFQEHKTREIDREQGKYIQGLTYRGYDKVIISLINDDVHEVAVSNIKKHS